MNKKLISRILFNDLLTSSKQISIHSSPPRYFYLKNKKTKKVIDIPKKPTYPGANVTTRSKDKLQSVLWHKDNQLWMEDTSHYLRTKLNTFALEATSKYDNCSLQATYGHAHTNIQDHFC